MLDLGTIESKRRIRVLVAANEDPELFSPARSETSAVSFMDPPRP